MVYLRKHLVLLFLNHFHGVKPTLINFEPKFPPPSPCHWGGSFLDPISVASETAISALSEMDSSAIFPNYPDFCTSEITRFGPLNLLNLLVSTGLIDFEPDS